ncbi:MAG: cell division protein [Pedobacter sp.]|nr:MAG: cell division protein [Pedobacter sp.]
MILARPERVFDFSRDIDLHQVSTQRTNEQVIDGRMSGLIELGESVTWRAKHFGIYQKLTSKITAFERPHSFTDEMVTGAFRSFSHVHNFQAVDEGTRMTDIFTYVSPLGIFGRIADCLFLKKYMTGLLATRNQTIKDYAEQHHEDN